MSAAIDRNKRVRGATVEPIEEARARREAPAAPAEPVARVGKVIGLEGPSYLVEREGERLRCARALGCLVKPELGDQVLFAGEGRLYILSVLEREGAEPPAIDLPGDLAIRAERLVFAARRALQLATEGELGLDGRSVALTAEEGSVRVGTLRYLGKRALLRVEQSKLFGGLLDTIAERVSVNAKRSYRNIEELDAVRAEQIDYRAEATASIRGKNAMVSAEALIKLLGAQIHLG